MEGLPDLGIGITELNLNMEGKVPSSNDLLNRNKK